MSFGLPLAHRAWRLLPAHLRRAALARAASALAPRITPDPGRPATSGLVVAGEIGRASGLGEGARIMAAAAAALGVPCALWEAGLLRGPERAELAEKDQRAELAENDRRPEPPAPAPDAPLVLHVNPPLLPASLIRLGRARITGRRVVGYWAWELPVAPPSWARDIRFVHEVWAPSRFTASALEALLDRPVRVVPHALAARRPEPSALGRAAFGLPDDAVLVLVSFSLASSFERKNPLGAIAAFRRAFGDRPDRVLVLKVGKPDHAPADMRRIESACAGLGNVRILTRTLSVADTHALTRAADIVLSLHRSEGFGLVPAEAMMLGRAVIATGWSGTEDFLDDEVAARVPYRLVPARDPRGVFEAPGAVWADADIEAAASLLVRLADDAELRAAIGAAAHRCAQTRFGSLPLRDALAAIGAV